MSGKERPSYTHLASVKKWIRNPISETSRKCLIAHFVNYRHEARGHQGETHYPSNRLQCPFLNLGLMTWTKCTGGLEVTISHLLCSGIYSFYKQYVFDYICGGGTSGMIHIIYSYMHLPITRLYLSECHILPLHSRLLLEHEIIVIPCTKYEFILIIT